MAANAKAEAKIASKAGPKPKRPLSGYNLFYRYKRNKVLEATAKASSDDSNAIINSILTAIPGLEGIPPNSPIFTLPPTSLDEVRASSIRKSMEGKLFPNENAHSRVHRRVHGMGFVEMGRTMRDMWGNIDTITKNVFCELADVGRVRYRNLMGEYKTRMEREMPSSSSSTVMTAMVSIDMSVVSQEMGGKRTVGPSILKKEAKRAKKSGAVTSSSTATMVAGTTPLPAASAKATDASAMNRLMALRSNKLSSLLPPTPRIRVQLASNSMVDAQSIATTSIHPGSPAQQNKAATATAAAAVSPVDKNVIFSNYKKTTPLSISRRVSESELDMRSFEPLPLCITDIATPQNSKGRRLISAANNPANFTNSNNNSLSIDAMRSSMMNCPPLPFERKVANNTRENISHDEIIAKTEYLEKEQIMLKNVIRKIQLKNAIQRIEQSILRKETTLNDVRPELFRQQPTPSHIRQVQGFSPEGSIDRENRRGCGMKMTSRVSAQDFIKLIDELDDAIGDNDGAATTHHNPNPSFIFGQPIYEMCDDVNDKSVVRMCDDIELNSNQARMT